MFRGVSHGHALRPPLGCGWSEAAKDAQKCVMSATSGLSSGWKSSGKVSFGTFQGWHCRSYEHGLSCAFDNDDEIVSANTPFHQPARRAPQCKRQRAAVVKKDGGGAWPHLREGAAVAEVRRRHKTANRIVRHVEGRRDERADAGVVPAEPDVVGVGGELVGARWAVRRAARRQEVPTLSRLTGVRTFRHNNVWSPLPRSSCTAVMKDRPRHRVARHQLWTHSQRRKEGRRGEPAGWRASRRVAALG